MIEKIKNIKPEEKMFLAFVIFSLVLISFIYGYYFLTFSDFDWQSDIIHQRGPKSYRALDGQIVADDISLLKPIAIMLENHIESRPIAGLESASIIYEVIVEGDITRFLALFDPEIKTKKVGPVRSVRPFFVEIAEEWNSVLFHAGGSKDAMHKLTYSEVYNVNEISSDGIYFWRDSNREMPHNLFTSIDLMKRAIEAKEIEMKAGFEPWLFKDDSPDAPDYPDYPREDKWEKAHEIKVDFNNNPLYQVKYIYNPENNNYTRYLADNVHKTERGIILKAKNIIIQYVIFDIIDDYGRLDVNVTGKGRAEVYKDGRMIEAYWIKEKNSRTRFYDLGHREIKFNRGTIWVELVFN